MTGATLTADFQDAEILAALKRLQDFGSNMTPLAKAVGVGLVKTTQMRFQAGRDPEGNAWKPLNPIYAETKKGPGILRGPRWNAVGLSASVTYQLEGTNGVRVGSKKRYAAVHQFGAVIRPVKAKALTFRMGGHVFHCKQVVIPARPYLGIGEADRQEIMDQVAFAYAGALAGYQARQALERG